MKAQIVEQVELFTEAELESLEFTPEEIEAIEQERVPDLDSISFEDIAENLLAVFEFYVNPPAEIPETGRQDIAMRDPVYRQKQQLLSQLLIQYTRSSEGDIRRPGLLSRIERLQREMQAIERRHAEEQRRQELQRLFGHLRRPSPPPRPPSPRPPSPRPSPPPRPPAPGPQSRQNQARSLTRSLSGLGSRRSGGASS